MPTQAPLQVLLHGDPAAPQFELVPNPDGRGPDAFENYAAHTNTPRFGPGELVHLAEEAERLAYRLRRFEFTGDRNAPIVDDTLVDEAGGLLLEAFRAAGVKEVMRLLTHELLRVIITGVVLYKPGVGQITIRSGGVLFTANADAASDLLAAHWRSESDD